LDPARQEASLPSGKTPITGVQQARTETVPVIVIALEYRVLWTVGEAKGEGASRGHAAIHRTGAQVALGIPHLLKKTQDLFWAKQRSRVQDLAQPILVLTKGIEEPPGLGLLMQNLPRLRTHLAFKVTEEVRGVAVSDQGQGKKSGCYVHG
jgi:hypothetical protein